MHQSHSMDTDVTVDLLVHPWASYSHTHLSPGFYLHRKDVALEGVGHFSRKLAEEKWTLSALKGEPV